MWSKPKGIPVIIPAIRQRGAIGKTQDGCPIENVGHDLLFFVIPAGRQRGPIRNETEIDSRYKMSGMTPLDGCPITSVEHDLFFSVIPAIRQRGAIGKTQDGCPIENVGHDPTLLRHPRRSLAGSHRKKPRWMPD